MGIGGANAAGILEGLDKSAEQLDLLDRAAGARGVHGSALPVRVTAAPDAREVAAGDLLRNGSTCERPLEAAHASASTAPGESLPAGIGAGEAPGGRARTDQDVARSISASLDAVIAKLRGLDGDRLEERLGLVGFCENRLAAVRVQTVTALVERDGEAKASDAVRTNVGQSRSSAKREVRLAGQLAEMPETSGALAEGSITPQHARMIAEAAEQASPAAPIDEAELLEAAEREPADVFGNTVRDHVNARIGDDIEERRRHQRSRRRLSFKRRPDGMFDLFGTFDPLTGSRIETALAAAATKLWRAEDPKNRATPRQRLADALELLVTGNGVAGGTTAKTTAQGVDLLVIADYDTVAGRLRDARLVDGTPLSAEELVHLACDATILPALFNRQNEPLWLGRGKRHASARQRAVLAERDKGCIGCGISPNWCQAHHVAHWEHGGPTDLDNLCLLCSHCHHLVHTNRAEIVRGPDGGFVFQHLQRPPPGNNGSRTTAGTGRGEVDRPLRC